MRKTKQNQRISSSKKNAKKKAWYKEQADLLDFEHIDVDTGYYGSKGGNNSETKRMKVNYDLFNNILDLSDFEYVCKPFGAEAGELPAKMVNRDIVSGKIKAVLGMEMKRASSWKVLATNSEATTRKEQEEFGRIREYVISQTMKPIREQIELKYQEQLQGGQLSEQQVAQIKEQIEQETKAQTPDAVKKYMQREHQDPAEVLSHQLLEYLIQKCNVKRKFNKAFKHALLSAKGVMYVGILNGEPEIWNVNSMRFNCDKSPDEEFVEDGEWATCEYRMTPSEIVKYFGDELSQDDIDMIYESWSGHRNDYDDLDFFALDETNNDYDNNSTIRIIHCTWKSLRKIGFLTYEDENGQEQMTMVDEKYKIDLDGGDIKIEWEWIPEVYETWKIKVAEPIYVNMRPIPGQFKDLDNLYYCKLPYYGVIYDNMNSQETALMDRLKMYQYYFNILNYRFELLAASDKGKKVLMNINAVPDSAGIDIEKWQYFMESTPYMWYDPNEEGKGYQDANTVAKVIDLSYAGQMNQYIEMMEYIRTQCGRSVGITDAVEGQISANESVRNSQQNLIQTSNILEPYFELHSHMKKNVLQALIETAKIAYSQKQPKKLSYFLDDMSVETFKLDIGLLDNSTLGVFVENSSKAEEVMNTIRQLAHAAMQSQKAELSDVISLMKQDGIVEAEEALRAAEQNRREFDQAQNKAQMDAAAEEAEKVRQREREKFEEEKKLIVLKEEEKRKTEIIKGGLVAASFNPDQDKDQDGVNDFIEIARHGLEADIKQSQQQLEREKFQHQKEVDNKKLQLDDKKLDNEKAKLKAAQVKNTPQT